MDQLTEVAFAARAGDEAALARLVRSTQADVWRLSAHLVDPEAADDLTQECFERAIRYVYLRWSWRCRHYGNWTRTSVMPW